MSKAGGGNSFFVLFNTLVDKHLATMSGLEWKTLCVLLRHADGAGISFPGPELIAKKIGQSKPRHVYRALANLTASGFIEHEDDSGGRGKIAKRKIVIPKTLAKTARVSRLKKTGQNVDETLAVLGANSGQNGHRNSGVNGQMKGLLNPLLEQPSNSRPKNAAAAGSFSDNQKEARQILYENGIQDPTASQLVKEFPSMTPEAIENVLADLSDSAQGGLKVIAIRENIERVMEELREQAEYERAVAENRAEEEAQNRHKEAEARKIIAGIAEQFAELSAMGVAATARLEGIITEWIASLSDAELSAARDRCFEGAQRRLLTIERLRTKPISNSWRIWIEQFWARECAEDAATFDKSVRKVGETIADYNANRAEQFARIKGMQVRFTGTLPIAPDEIPPIPILAKCAKQEVAA